MNKETVAERTAPPAENATNGYTPAQRAVGLLKAVRPVQWLKNGFVVAPAIFAGMLTEFDVMLVVGVGFLLFSLVSSAVYLLNDCVDAASDRLHPVKRFRPIASGRVPVSLAYAVLTVFLIAGIAGGYLLSPGFAAILAGYFGLNVLYSWKLKNIVILDVFCIAAGFVLRVEAGALLVGVAASDWLLLCTSMLALFLGFSKRRYELGIETEGTRKVLGDYSVQFLDKMMGVVETVTLVTYLLYVVSPETQDRFGRGMLLTIPFVAYGIFRYQYLIYHKESADNPTDTLLADKPLLLTVFSWLTTASAVVFFAG